MLTGDGCGWVALIGCRSRKLRLDARGHGRNLLGAKPRGGLGVGVGGRSRGQVCPSIGPLLLRRRTVRCPSWWASWLVVIWFPVWTVLNQERPAVGALSVPETTPDSVPERHAHGRPDLWGCLMFASMRILQAPGLCVRGCRDGSVFAGAKQGERGMDDTPSFGYWIRRRRKALDLTRSGLARRVGLLAWRHSQAGANERGHRRRWPSAWPLCWISVDEARSRF